jgi:hypothetical protein
MFELSKMSLNNPLCGGGNVGRIAAAIVND